MVIKFSQLASVAAGTYNAWSGFFEYPGIVLNVEGEERVDFSVPILIIDSCTETTVATPVFSASNPDAPLPSEDGVL